jgi:hypothetical protein
MKSGRQDFETCAIGVLPSGVELNLGCVFWGHECSFTYKIVWSESAPLPRHGCGTHSQRCRCTSTYSRYPRASQTINIVPQPQKPSNWDPSISPPSHPGGVATEHWP